jgi:hypothetical protein
MIIRMTEEQVSRVSELHKKCGAIEFDVRTRMKSRKVVKEEERDRKAEFGRRKVSEKQVRVFG